VAVRQAAGNSSSCIIFTITCRRYFFLLIRRNIFCPEKREIPMDLAQKKCTTYIAGSPPLTRKETFVLLGEVSGWSIDNGHLTRTFELDNCSQCVDFFNEVMALSTPEGHIPDICLKESRFIEISYYTYPAGGLTLNDFIMAAKLNARG
jgi:4a-hydroxytetrahydrobiopterin dehydratase